MKLVSSIRKRDSNLSRSADMFYEWQWWNIDKNNLRMYFELIGGGTANRQKSELTHAQYLIYILLGLKFTKFLEFLFLLISLDF